MAVVVGNFAKTTTAVNGTTQSFAHGLGATPKALILFTTSGSTSGTFRTGQFSGFGFTDQDRTSISYGMATGHNITTTNTLSRVAAKALTVALDNGTVAAECSVTSWDATNVNLTWDVQATTAAWIIGFIAIGGNVQSKVVDHTFADNAGSEAITGAGFRPTLALLGFGSNLVGALPQNLSGAGETSICLGATDGTNQWAIAYGSDDAAGAADSRRSQRTDACLLALTIGELGPSWEAEITSFDSDGMTINESVEESAGAHLGVLFLRGVSFSLGSFNKDTGAATVAQDVTTAGLNPQAVLLASFQSTATTSVITEGRMGIGFSDGTNEVSGALTDADAADPTNVAAVMVNDKAFTKVNNDTDTIDAACDVTMGTGKFTVSWTTNDAVATQMLYLAMASSNGGQGGGGGQGGQGGGGGNGGGNGGGGPPGGGGGGGPPGQTRRTIIGSQRRRRRSLIGIF
jgi:hypothetical protein